MIKTININLKFPALLTLVFVLLKLTKTVTWSWQIVLSPMWVSLSLLVLFIVVLKCILGDKLHINK